jgi:hypothetical protein
VQHVAELVQELQSSDENSQVQAAGALAQLAYESTDSQQLIADAHGAIDMLAQLLHSSSPEGKLYAAKTLASLSSGGSQVQQQIAAAPGVIPNLVQLLESNLPEHVAAAALLFANLAGDDEKIQQQITAASGAMLGLKQLLDSIDQDVHQVLSSWSSRQSIRALVNLLAGTAQHTMPGWSGVPEPQQSALDGGKADRPCYKDSLGESHALCSHDTGVPLHSIID